MRNTYSKRNDVLLSFHRGCMNVIFDALGIREMKRSGLYIAGWYFGGLLLAYSIGMVRREPDAQSLVAFLLSLLLIIFLSISGLKMGHLKNRSRIREVKSEK